MKPTVDDAFDAQPWASDEPARVQLDRLTRQLTEAHTALRLCVAVLEPMARDYHEETAAAVAYRLANDALR